MMTTIHEIQKKLEQVLKPERYVHTLGVMYTAASLAMRYEADIRKALLAGLLHDCGKFCSVKEQKKLCEDYGIRLSPAELKMPALIHAKLGAFLAEHEYDVTDPEILGAVLYHTTGRPGMTLLEKIVYLADYIEPSRRPIPGLDDVRHRAFTEIDTAVCLSAEATIHYLKSGGMPIDPMTIQTCEYYRRDSK